MKANKKFIGIRVIRIYSPAYQKTGTIVALSRQGDEVVIVEWDHDFSVSPQNINDLTIEDKKTVEKRRKAMLAAYGIPG